MSAIMTLSEPITDLSMNKDDPKLYNTFIYIDIRKSRRKDCKILCQYAEKYGHNIPDDPYCGKAIMLTTREILYYQGWTWLFSPKLFKVQDPSFYATDKERMQFLLSKYLRIGPRFKGNYEIYKEFMSKWKDGYLFKITW